VTLEEMEAAQRSATKEDQRRLRFGFDALRVCTTGDLGNLSVREVRARRKMIQAATADLEGLGDVGREGSLIVSEALVEMAQRKAVYDDWIKKHQVPRDNG
jgi:hypothetical protein